MGRINQIQLENQLMDLIEQVVAQEITKKQAREEYQKLTQKKLDNKNFFTLVTNVIGKTNPDLYMQYIQLDDKTREKTIEEELTAFYHLEKKVNYLIYNGLSIQEIATVCNMPERTLVEARKRYHIYSKSKLASKMNMQEDEKAKMLIQKRKDEIWEKKRQIKETIMKERQISGSLFEIAYERFLESFQKRNSQTVLYMAKDRMKMGISGYFSTWDILQFLQAYPDLLWKAPEEGINLVFQELDQERTKQGTNRYVKKNFDQIATAILAKEENKEQEEER